MFLQVIELCKYLGANKCPSACGIHIHACRCIGMTDLDDVLLEPSLVFETKPTSAARLADQRALTSACLCLPITDWYYKLIFPTPSVLHEV